jgi:hypothetical protein
VVLAHPNLLTRIPELKDVRLYYTPGARLMLRAGIVEERIGGIDDFPELWRAIEQRHPSFAELSPEMGLAIAQLIIVHRWPLPETLNPPETDGRHVRAARLVRKGRGDLDHEPGS